LFAKTVTTFKGFFGGSAMLKQVDSKGVRVGSYFSMLVYYGGDVRSLAVIRTFPLSRCTIVPCVRISISKNDARWADMEFVYPAESVRDHVELSGRAINAFRRLAKNKRGGWEFDDMGDRVQFWKAGCVIPPGGIGSFGKNLDGVNKL
jgi:hypothetical protein